MSNVLKFEPTVAGLRKRLDQSVEGLKELYDNHARVCEVLCRIEEFIDEAETDHDDLVACYAQKVGIQSVEVGYLEFCTRGINYEDEESDPEA